MSRNLFSVWTCVYLQGDINCSPCDFGAGFFFIVSVYLYCRWRSNYQEGDELDQINRFNPATILCLFKPGPGFPSTYMSWSFVLVFNDFFTRLATPFDRIWLHWEDRGSSTNCDSRNYKLGTCFFSAMCVLAMIYLIINYQMLPWEE